MDTFGFTLKRSFNPTEAALLVSFELNACCMDARRCRKGYIQMRMCVCILTLVLQNEALGLVFFPLSTNQCGLEAELCVKRSSAQDSPAEASCVTTCRILSPFFFLKPSPSSLSSGSHILLLLMKQKPEPTRVYTPVLS